MDANEIGVIVAGLMFVVIGSRLLVQPEKMLRRTIRDKPQLAGDKRAVIIAQAIGASFIVIGLWMLAIDWFAH